MPMRDYNEIASYLKTNGILSSPRGMETYELINAKVQCTAGAIVNRVGMSKRLGYLETLMLIGGIFELGLIKDVAPKANLKLYEKQSDYGLRVRNQVPLVIDELKRDRNSRRAVIQFNGTLHFGTDNIACTMNAQFLIRNGTFIGIFNMRSWDIVYGLPMDLMMFGGLTRAIARCVGEFPIVELNVNASSMHLYKATQGLAMTEWMNKEFRFSNDWPTEWNAIREMAEELARKHGTWLNVPTGIIESNGYNLRTDF